MPAKNPLVISCMNGKLRDALVNSVVFSELEGERKRRIIDELKELPYCRGDVPMGFMEESKKHRRVKGERQPSKYNLFIGGCMKEQSIKKFSEAPQAMRSCVARWKEEKEKLRKRYAT